MPVPLVVHAEQTRRDALGAVVPWVLITDLEQLLTGLSDPVIEQGVRNRLDALLAALTATLTVGGTVEVTNDAGSPLPVSGTVEVTNDVGNPLPISGTVAVGSMPEVEIKNDSGNPVPVSGTVAVSNFPATQPVSGTVEVANDVGNPLPVSGTVAVSNFPASVEVANDSGSPLPVSGTVAVSNFPATQPVSGTVEVANDVGNPLPVSGTVTVGNFPASTEIANDVGNPVPVSGTVTAGNLADLSGTWSYAAGASGTVTLTGSKRVIGIAAHATTAGSFTINGGDAIPVPANSGIEIVPLANLVDPVLVFTGTDSYFVESIV